MFGDVLVFCKGEGREAFLNGLQLYSKDSLNAWKEWSKNCKEGRKTAYIYIDKHHVRDLKELVEIFDWFVSLEIWEQQDRDGHQKGQGRKLGKAQRTVSWGGAPGKSPLGTL